MVLLSAYASGETSIVAEGAADLSDSTAGRLLLSATLLIIDRLLAVLSPAALSSMDAMLAMLGLAVAVGPYV